ncbi:hypothetical protein, partial [Anaerosporobacter sp.]|uniref:hypothetical protein n=1 Tax=Anaerosporobacter sp. TaxID=1872529 RepID=UPI00286F2D69
PLGEGVLFCTKCGTKREEESAPVAQPASIPMENVNQPAPQPTPVYSPIPDENQQAKNNKQGKMIAGIFGVVAVLAVVFFIYQGFFAYPSKPAQVAEKCIKAVMVDFDAKEANKYMITVENVDYADIKEAMSEIEDMGAKISNVKATDTKIEGKYAEVTLNVTISWLGMSTTEDMTVSLEKVSGRWKVNDLN